MKPKMSEQTVGGTWPSIMDDKVRSAPPPRPHATRDRLLGYFVIGGAILVVIIAMLTNRNAFLTSIEPNRSAPVNITHPRPAVKLSHDWSMTAIALVLNFDLYCGDVPDDIRTEVDAAIQMLTPDLRWKLDRGQIFGYQGFLFRWSKFDLENYPPSQRSRFAQLHAGNCQQMRPVMLGGRM
jgi:hypothetical protein